MKSGILRAALPKGWCQKRGPYLNEKMSGRLRYSSNHQGEHTKQGQSEQKVVNQF